VAFGPKDVIPCEECHILATFVYGFMFSGVSANLWKAVIRFVMYVCLSVRPHGKTRLPLGGF
jgi:hypothetical protein